MSRLQTAAALTAIEADVKLRRTVARLTHCSEMHSHVTSHTLLNSFISFYEIFLQLLLNITDIRAIT